MLSKAGCVYFYSCHMFISVLQMYHDLRVVEYGYGDWSTQYEATITWLIEEIVFPPSWEQVNSADNLVLQESGETAGDAIYLHLENNLKQAVEVDENGLSRDIVSYLRYCKSILNILATFRDLLHSDSVKETKYFEHFQDNLIIFANLENAITGSLNKKESKVTATDCLEIQQFAKRMSAEWLQQLINVIDSFTADKTENSAS